MYRPTTNASRPRAATGRGAFYDYQPQAPPGGWGSRMGDNARAFGAQTPGTQYQAFGGGGQQPAPAANPMQGNVQSSIQPQPVFSQDYTQRAANLAAALAVPARADILNQVATPGFSVNSPSTQQAAGWQYGQAMGQAALAPQQIGMQHSFANLQNMLAGQQAREQEAQQWAGLGLQNNNAFNQYQQGLQGGWMNLLNDPNRWWG